MSKSQQRAQAEQQDRLVQHDLEMALHQGNTRMAQYGPSPGEQARLLDTVLETELQTEDPGLGNLSAKDFPLSNYEERVDSIEFKLVQEILNIFSKARYPHPRSGLQGLARAWAAGDSGNRLRALDLDEMANDEAFLLGTYSRAKRGEGMAQQESSGKMITESHAIHDDVSSARGGGGLRNRWRKWRD